MTIKLTTYQMNKARTLAAVNGQPLESMVDLMKRRIVRQSARPQHSGSVKRAQPYTMIAE